MNSTGDSFLVERIVSREREAMLLLYDRYSTLVFSVALQLLRDVETSERVTQDTFLGLWRDGRQLTKGHFEVRTWLLVRSRQLAVEANRELGAGARKRKFDENPQSESAQDVSHSSFDMVYEEGLTTQEIAEITGKKVEEIGRELLEAMQKLMQNED